MQNLPLEISISSPTTSMDSRDDGIVHIRITDSLSNTVLADLEMTPGRFWRLCQGSQLTVKGSVSDNLSRVGTKMRTQIFLIPRELIDYKIKDASEVEAIAEANGYVADHWDEWSTYKTNQGWQITAHWYTDPTDDELKEENRYAI